jgi:hypothetical protein
MLHSAYEPKALHAAARMLRKRRRIIEEILRQDTNDRPAAKPESFWMRLKRWFSGEK